MLIDNYIDDTVLTMLSKRADRVDATIYTCKVSKQLQLDIDKHNAQYPPITVRTFSKAHDRFLIIDDTVYLIGASIRTSERSGSDLRCWRILMRRICWEECEDSILRTDNDAAPVSMCRSRSPRRKVCGVQLPDRSQEERHLPCSLARVIS